MHVLTALYTRIRTSPRRLRSATSVGAAGILSLPLVATILIVGLTFSSCGDSDGSCDTATPWVAGQALSSIEARDPLGYLDRRGIIHSHSHYSHDACDGNPVVDGVRDEQCFDDLRRGMCQTRHDFMMLTDHPADFREAPFELALLHREARGDRFVRRNGNPMASWAACPDDDPILVLAGSESRNVMAVGLEGHVAESVAERSAVYNSTAPEDAARLRNQGAVVLLSHPEDWSVEELMARDIDGFEMYNLHANLLQREAFAKAGVLLRRLAVNDPGLPHPDLSLLALINEDPRYLLRWGSVLARGKKQVTIFATDAHRNSLPPLMQDGERVDSYRRMLLWFSNHLLIETERDGSWDDRHLKQALRAGRLYGAFEVMGYPEGFSYYAAAGSTRTPMGSDVALADQPTLRVRQPSVRNLDPTRTAPVLQTRLLRAVEGGFVEVASADGDIDFVPQEAGAYRAEVRMVPHHLREDFGSDADTMLAKDFVWIYSNPIYVR